MRSETTASVEQADILNLDEYERLVVEYGDHEILTREQEVELAKRIEKGDLAAKDELIRSNLRLVVKFASDYQHHGRPTADNLANGIEGLIRAVEKFDWRRGYKFSTYAVNWVKQSVRRSIDNQQEAIRVPVHLEERMRQINRAQDKLEGQLGREPTVEELAEALECEVDVVEQTLADRLQITSLDQLVGENEKTALSEFVPDTRPGTAQEVSDQATKEHVRKLIREELDPEEQAVMAHLYYNGHNGDRKSVAQELGITIDKVRALETQAIGRLSELATGEPAEEAEVWFEQHLLPETTEELKDAVWNYKTAYPEMTFIEIARRLEISARRANNYYHAHLKNMPDLPD